jgi:hypothetical protein
MPAGKPLPESTREALRERIVAARATGERLSARQLARELSIDPHTASKYLKRITVDLNAPMASKGRDTGLRRDLLDVLDEVAENFAGVALDQSRRLRAQLLEGQTLDASMVQVLTALGITLDKLSALRKEEQTALYQRVLRADNEEALDQVIAEIEQRYARLLASPMGAQA